jgi:L-alanine-DL-glutamate epimerase-like enolase superfamily enzyme
MDKNAWEDTRKRAVQRLLRGEAFTVVCLSEMPQAGWYTELVTELPTIKDGYALPMEGPGLGTDLQPGFFERSDLITHLSDL